MKTPKDKNSFMCWTHDSPERRIKTEGIVTCYSTDKKYKPEARYMYKVTFKGPYKVISTRLFKEKSK